MLRFSVLKVSIVTVLFAVFSQPSFSEESLKLHSMPSAHFSFEGEVGSRVEANLNNWLLRAPYANPGMIEMFKVRDRNPKPQIVPWAGEFVGKYLISAIQANRMVDDPALGETIQDVVDRLIETQAEDGYLGPFQKDERLLGHWDLWGHYHIIQALLMWNEQTGDDAALEAATRAADLVCKTYLDTDRRPLDAGSDEMNLAIIHGMGLLYRKTGNERYLDMMRMIEEDWKSAGDYFREGLAGTDFYKIPRPRWESLHDLQGLKQLYLITGNEDYKTAFVNLWRSIQKFDRHNTGGFSTGEAAIGNPYSPGAIETCCTTAWSALTLDMLTLTGDPKVAEELEWSFFNSILGSQHPSGRWWTYNTPMNGKREASAHTIVFQSRAGTPELNCCSVNAPRGLGMLSEWAIMKGDADDIVINYLASMSATVPLEDGRLLTLKQTSNYPTAERYYLQPTLDGTAELTLKIRVPSWAVGSTAAVNGNLIEKVTPGEYLEIKRVWKTGDSVLLNIKIPTWTWVGDGDKAGKISIYHGPLLLAYDQRFNDYDSDAIPTLDYQNLEEKPVYLDTETFQPLIVQEFKGADGTPLRLCDFATAGALGTEYVSWLPVENAPPPPFHVESPKEGEAIPADPNLFTWTGPRISEDKTYRFVLSENADLSNPIVTSEDLNRNQLVVRDPLKPDTTYYWLVTAINENGEKPVEGGVHTFRVDPSLEKTFIDHPALFEFRQDELIAGSYLQGSADPVYGYLEKAEGIEPATGRDGKSGSAIAFNQDGMVRYKIPYFPLENYTFAAWVKPSDQPYGLAQIFSAWAKGGDDPLRVVIEDGKVFARVEGQGHFGTQGIPIEKGKWTHVAAVKSGENLALYVNGENVTDTGIPAMGRHTSALDFALGANPHHTGPEFYHGAIDDFAFYGKALTPEQIRKIYEEGLDLSLNQ
ncbi:MAG: glycoside hydrolase family 127 protein [Candidatus Omnitrophica bacterium]|nr:glycoside hydrolase family 127 protein [Candidatus Omnitrophota bacterium]